MVAKRKPERRQLILEALARELENHPGERITTARLARAAAISEAALYRHFASKAKMFEALIEFAEESIFSRVNRILEEEDDAAQRCQRILYLLLAFAAGNPGLVSVLMGDALVGERERLRSRVEQFFARIETQLKQILRESAARREGQVGTPPAVGANLMLALVEGRMHQFLRSRFKRSPLDQWEAQWRLIHPALFAGR